MTASDDALVEQWRDLQAQYLRTSMVLERELSARFGIGLSEYEVLDLVCDNAAPTECRMKDLSQLTALTQSALSRVVDRLEKAGLVHRSACSDDRRALIVGLTKAGAALHAEAAPVHRELLAEHLAATS